MLRYSIERFGQMNKRKTDNNGFSLIELIIVIAIMAILIAVLAPQFLRYIEKSKQGKDADTVGVIHRAISVAMVDNSIPDRPESFAGDITRIDSLGTMPKFAAAIREYIGDYTFLDFKTRNIRSNAYSGQDIYVVIDAEQELVRVTVSSNTTGVDDIVIE